MLSPVELIYPQWPAPENISAMVTTRLGGVSSEPFDSLNLADHVPDKLQNIRENRQRLAFAAGLPLSRFHWLKQVHGHDLVKAEDAQKNHEADGAYTQKINSACVVMTADCLPVLLCDQRGQQVMAVHAGWRGLAKNILARAIEKFETPSAVLAWLGPAISQKHFELGQEVYDVFTGLDADYHSAFKPAKQGQKYFGDLYHLARIQLLKQGVDQIYGGDFCTFSDKERFYSYRRDGLHSGRMASFIWRKN